MHLGKVQGVNFLLKKPQKSAGNGLMQQILKDNTPLQLQHGEAFYVRRADEYRKDALRGRKQLNKNAMQDWNLCFAADGPNL